MESFASVVVQNGATTVSRPLANFHPDQWGDRFLNYTATNEATQIRKEEEAKKLKELVLKELLVAVRDPKDRLIYIDAIQRLGVSYHFEDQIKANLRNFHEKVMFDDDHLNNDLHYVSLRFRLLRQHGFHVSCDVFDKFKSDDGSFQDCFASDVEGMLTLYEASHLRVHDEDTLVEALEFASSRLTSFITQSSTSMADKIAHALKLPLHKRSVRLESRRQISFHEYESSHDKILLRFAKLDFDCLQELHKKEIQDLTRWSRNLDLTVKLPFVRDRVVEAYFWTLGVYHEPKYSNARMILNKLFKIISVIDDIYDAYGTVEELEIFTEAIERWDRSCIEKLPNYMKLFYQAILDLLEEFEQDLAKEGRSFTVYYLRQEMKASSRAYLHEAKWCKKKIVPSYDDYMKNGIISSGYFYMITASYLGMKEITSKDDLEWIHLNSKGPKASCVLSRLLNDIGSNKFEQKRGHVASAVECYIEQFNITEEEAHKELQLHIDDAWKDLNEETLRTTKITMPLLAPVINLSRALYDVYQTDEDGYTMSKYMQAKIADVLIYPTMT